MDAGIFSNTGGVGTDRTSYSIILSNPANPANSKYAAFITGQLPGTVANQTTKFDYS